MMDAKARLDKDGYAIIPGALSAETISSVCDFLQNQVGNHTTIISLLSAKSELTFAEKQMLTGHFSFETRMSEALRVIPKDPGLRQCLQSMFGSSSLYMHMPPTARFVTPGNMSAAVPAHQDRAYNAHMQQFLTVWIPLVEIDDLCGGVSIYRGSQSAKLDPGKRNEIWFEPVETEGYERVHCTPMSPGDILVMTPDIVHASMPNLSDRIRLSADLRFFPVPQSEKHFLDMQTWAVCEPSVKAESYVQ